MIQRENEIASRAIQSRSMNPVVDVAQVFRRESEFGVFADRSSSPESKKGETRRSVGGYAGRIGFVFEGKIVGSADDKDGKFAPPR